MNWAAEEFKTLNLDDARLNARAVLLAERLSNKPTESIPGCLSRLGRNASGLSPAVQRQNLMASVA